MKIKLLSLGSMLAALLSGICWVKVLLILGVSGFGMALASKLGEYNRLLSFLSVGLLGLSYYFLEKTHATASRGARLLVYGTAALVLLLFVSKRFVFH